MATTSKLKEKSDPFDFLNERGIHTEALYRRLGLLDGLLVGAVVALFYWLPKLIPLRGMAIEQKFAGVLLSSVALLVVGALIGWLTGRFNSGWFSTLGWLGLAVSFALLLGYLPPAARVWRIWLSNGRFWGLPIYDLPLLRVWWVFATNGFLLIIFLTVLGMLQPNRLRASWEQRRENGRLSLASLGRLLLPALVLAPIALVTPDLLNRDLWAAYRMVNQAIGIVQSTDDDLFVVGQERGLLLTSFNSVQAQMQGEHRLALAAYDPLTDSTELSLTFENGAWLVCNIGKNDREEPRLAGCRDMGARYAAGMENALTRQPLPDDCANCAIERTAAWESWLAERQPRFVDGVVVEREAVGGRFVVLRAESAGGETAVVCLLEGLNRIRLHSCEDVASPLAS